MAFTLLCLRPLLWCGDPEGGLISQQVKRNCKCGLGYLVCPRTQEGHQAEVSVGKPAGRGSERDVQHTD